MATAKYFIYLSISKSEEEKEEEKKMTKEEKKKKTEEEKKKKAKEKRKKSNLIIRYRDNGIDVKAPSGFSLAPYFFDEKAQQIKERSTYPEKDDFNKRLVELVTHIKTSAAETLEPITKEWLKTAIDKYHYPNKYKIESTGSKPPTLFEYIQKNFIDEIFERRNKKNARVSKNTAIQYSIMFNHLKRFCEYKGREYDFIDIDEQFGKDYVAFREIQFISKNTIGKELRFFKSVIKSADIKSTKLNIRIDSEYKGIQPAKEEAGNIALTNDELSDLINMRLHNHPYLDRIRDQFVILCRTACRYSDLDKVGLLVENGLIKMKQEKTGNMVYIPIHPDVQRIMDKYEGKLPKVMAAQYFNESMKKICSAIWRMRKESYSTLKTIGGETITVSKPRYKWVSSHTGRRTFATNEIDAGTPIPVIMAITGHKTQESFMKYVKKTQEDYARKMLELWNERLKGGNQ